VSPARAHAPLTAPVEDYLKAIYELERHGAAAGTKEIAAALGIAPASVSGMVRRLAEQGLMAHERYRGVRLTEQGRRAALLTLRRHRVIEAYLAEALGYPWDRVHDEAERLEHAASDELVDRMAAAIGEPATDPHGAPIPGRDGTMDEQRLASLDDLPPGAEARISRVEDDDPERLRYLGELGIRPGARVRVVERAPYGGPITLRVARTERHVGSELARHVLVIPPAAARLPFGHAAPARPAAADAGRDPAQSARRPRRRAGHAAPGAGRKRPGGAAPSRSRRAKNDRD
jgi:DtxR family transcriptional regulator, Mn-dependent transcriptional regulator